MTHYLNEIKKRFAELNYVQPSEIKSCTLQEVEILEQKLGFKLLASYREFLLWMGHGAGQLLRGSDCFYNVLLEIQDAAVELLKENGVRQPLPKDFFVFFMHQGYQFNFFSAGKGDDPSVQMYLEGSKKPVFNYIHNHFTEFLADEIEGHAQLAKRQ